MAERAAVQQALWALVGDAALALEAAGVPSPRFDAEELAADAFGVPRSRLRSLDRLDEAGLEAFRTAVARREGREPLQHILGHAWFRHVEVRVGPGVFVPRPETEVVVGWAVDRAREVAATGRPPLVADLCSGSGVVALAVADEVPEAEVHAVELSPEALMWTRRNLVGTRVRLHEGDATAPLPGLAPFEGRFDVVVSNPPYIPDDGVVRDSEVLQHDPPDALWGRGPDGLDVLRGVAARAAVLLRPGGWFVVEHADVQGVAVRQVLLGQGGWADVADRKDLAGRDRFATARRGVSPRGGGRMSRLFDCSDPDERTRGLEQAALAVRRGDLVVLPTDTVYGVGCDAFAQHGVAALLTAKGRGRDLPVPVLVGSPRTVAGLTTVVPAAAQALMEAFWPGALTLVVHEAPSLAWDLGDAAGTVALRMPLHPVAIELLTEVGPMAVSSANRSGEAPATTAAEAMTQLGDAVEVYLDSGPSAANVPSTIVDLTGVTPRVLRVGALSVDDLRTVCPDLEAPA